MRIYVAAPWANRANAQSVRDILVNMGHHVTSRWLDLPDTETGLPDNAQECVSAARADFDDIDSADTVLVLTDPRPIGVGHHVEIGYAFARGRHVVVAGPIKSIFHHLATTFPDWEAAKPHFQKENS